MNKIMGVVPASLYPMDLAMLHKVNKSVAIDARVLSLLHNYVGKHTPVC